LLANELKELGVLSGRGRRWLVGPFRAIQPSFLARFWIWIGALPIPLADWSFVRRGRLALKDLPPGRCLL
jgi:hypothetical protein